MADFIVTTLDDETFEGTETTGSPDGAGLSLREALALANGNAEADDITFAAALAGGTLTLTNGQLLINTDGITIDGDIDGDDVADITISGNNASRVFLITDFSVTSTISASLNGLVIQDGNAGFHGGGIYVAIADALTVTNSTVSGNSATTDGGGISGNFATITLINTTLSGNSAGGHGGGIHANAGDVTLINTTLSGNSAADDGGGIWTNASNVSLTNTTLSGNSAVDEGGGIFANAGTFALRNSIVAGNDAASDPETDGTLTLSGGNIVGDTFTVDSGSPQGGIALADIFAEVAANPFTTVQSGVLANNGGTVATIALAPDLANPAIDSGTGALPADTADLDGDGDSAEPLPVDARGFPRDNGTGVDLGAFEAIPLVVTTLDDELDAADTNLATADLNDLSLREALALANADPDADTITFDAALSGGTLTLTNGVLVISTDGITVDGDIDGDGKADIAISGNNASGVFEINDGSADGTISASLNGLVIQDGSAGFGGGINVALADALTLTNSTVSGNSATTAGGAISGNGAAITLINTTLSGNSAADDGGGIWTNASDVTLTNTTLSGNSAADEGGGIWTNASDVVLTNTTLSGNSATDEGGGIFANAGTFALRNSIVAGNDAASDPETDATFTSLTGGNIVGDTFTVDGGSPQGGIALTDIFAEVDANPFTNVQSGVLADNGGAVATIALNPDLANPAIDSGTGVLPADTADLDGDGNIAELLPVDARGFARDVDFDGNPPTPDLGAFEQQNGVDLVVTTLEDELDATDTDFATVNLNDLSLREALALAEQDPTSFDSITFDADLIGGVSPGVDDGVLTLVQGELAVFGNVSIDGDVNGDDVSDITVDGAGASSVFHIYTGTVALNGLTITGGDSAYGGGVAIGSGPLLTSADVTISNSAVIGNAAYLGGGILVNPTSSLTLTNATVAGNTAFDAGGGIYNGGTLTAIASTISGNASSYVYGSRAVGGGIHNSGAYGGTATLINSTVSGNYARYEGGGLYNGGDLTLINTTVANNSTSYYGLGGGGLFNAACGCGTSTLINSTFTGNYAGAGGGIRNEAGTVNLTNSIVAGNGTNEFSNFGTLVASGVNIVGIGPEADISDGLRQTPSLADLFAALTTIDPDGTPDTGDEFQAGVLADNGGPVQTVLILTNGVAHNAGDNAALPADDPQDLDGDTVTNETLPVDARGLGFTRVRSLTVDIGAVELQNTAPLVTIPIDDQNSPANAFWTFQLPAGTFTDLDSDPLTFTATLGNGDSLPDWLTFDAGTQTFTGTPPRNFVGPIELTVTANDGTDSESDTFLLTVDVSNPGPINLTPNPDTYNAGNTGEIINGLASNDTITGGLGNDFINGNDGDDTIDGGGASNVLHGDGGTDYVASTGNLNEGWGDAGTDQLFFIGDQNQLFGGEGNDWHGVGGTNNALAANGGNDWLGATGNFNTLNGQDGNDFLTTVGVGNVLHGETGNDWLGVSGDLNQLFGGADNDWLGATGDDNTLDGGAGNDTLVSAPGNLDTTFVFHAGYGLDEALGFDAASGHVVNMESFGLATFGQLQPFMAQIGTDVVITINPATIFTLRDVAIGTLTAAQFDLI